jgi:dTDP-4-dehydrorhamnose 3,5-epimerase-like enzyme
MNQSAYIDAVFSGSYPLDRRVPLDDRFCNENGVIQNLTLKPVTSTAVLTSVKNSIRANHYHKTDWHFTYVISGRVVYFERPVGSPSVNLPVVYKAGEMFFTPPMVEHAMFFPEDAVILTLAKNPRDHESHESDVTRVQFVTLDLAKAYLASKS